MSQLLGKKILIIEQDFALRDDLYTAFKALGADVRDAPNGRDGLNIALGHPPDLVIVEGNAPFVHGLEFVSILRTNYPFLPIVVLSTKGEISEIKAHQIGARAVIFRPLQMQDIVNVCGRFLVAKPDAAFRRFPRIDVNFPAEISLLESNSIVSAQVLNISKSGAFFQIAEGLIPAPGKVINFKIRAGDNYEYVIEGSAVVRWAKGDLAENRTKFGLEFSDLDSEVERALLKVLYRATAS